MSILKCKMCGGDLQIAPGATVAECEYCGTKQTVPTIDDEKKGTLFARANRLRFGCEFDKAAGVYETIIADYPQEAEAYWGLVLCKYGIEYVDDPATGKKIPTCHRSSFDSLMDDHNFEMAMENSDTLARSVYRSEAKQIEELRKGIIEVSSKEEPYDIFICYKETDENGERTIDSVLAQDTYDALTEKGYRVFFSRITLEDKLGQEYEPYIFAALNSAKVMLAFGTTYDYYNAVWVKNEWSRYLQLIAAGQKKTLIPCYKDIDAYDMPKEFTRLQAQDMGKIGAIQDLVRGIGKIVDVRAPRNAVSVEQTETGTSSLANTNSLLDRAFIFLEDGKWKEADGYCEKVLDIEPKSARAYLGKLMAAVHAHTKEELRNCNEPFDGMDSYQKIARFAEPALVEELKACNAYIRERNENARLTDIYNKAGKAIQEATTEEACKAAADAFATIPGFKDADALAQQSLEKAEVCRKDAVYASAAAKMAGEKVGGYESAIEIFRTIPGWKDAEEQINACRKKIEEIRAKEEAYRIETERKAEERRLAEEAAAKKRKKTIAIATPIVCACIAFAVVLKTVIIPNNNYNSAVALMNDGKIIDAYERLIALDGYKDSVEKANGIFDQYKTEKLKNAEVGDTVWFGAYEQDNNTSNGKEDIEWIVLAEEDGEILVISKYALDFQPYNNFRANITWEKCSLRNWLNVTFLNNAFSVGEQEAIVMTIVNADKNPEYSTNPGNAVNDKVFLLSITEAEKYFSSDSVRQCKPTEYAAANGAIVNSGNGNCWWWLRSPGAGQEYAAGAPSGGSVYYYGDNIGSDNCVRPAMWIDLNA